MRKILIALIILNVFACNEGSKTFFQPERVIEKEIIKEVSKKHEVLFAGYFNLSGPGNANCIYLDEKIDNVVDIETDCQSLLSINPKNSTVGQFPGISGTNLLVVNGEIRFTRNVSYTTGNDLEEDISGTDIVGSKRTDFLIQVLNGRIKITITIFKAANNNNLNEIIAERIFNEI